MKPAFTPGNRSRMRRPLLAAFIVAGILTAVALVAGTATTLALARYDQPPAMQGEVDPLTTLTQVSGAGLDKRLPSASTAFRGHDDRSNVARTSARPGGERLATRAPGGGRWSRSEVNGTRVYQRDDLIDSALTDARGRTNVERMQRGLAPVGPDGQSINLHHMLQTADSPIAELTQTFHQANSSVIHINPNTIPSGIDRAAFGAWRRDYWKLRACDFGGC